MEIIYKTSDNPRESSQEVFSNMLQSSNIGVFDDTVVESW